MAKIQFSNGMTVDFSGNPTQQDVEEVAGKLGLGNSATSTQSHAAPTGQIAAPTAAQLDAPGPIGDVGRFLGMGPLQRFLSAKLAGATDPQYNQTIEMLKQGGNTEAAQALSSGATTGKEVLGSAALTGASLALPFMGGLGIASKAASPALSFGERVGLPLLKSAGIGAGMATAGGLASGESLKQSFGEAPTGAVLGAALPVAGAAIRGVGRELSGLSGKLYSQFYSPTTKEIVNASAARRLGQPAAETTAQWVMNKGIMGSAEKQIDQIGVIRDRAGKELKQVTAAQTAKTNIEANLKDSIKEAVKSVRAKWNEGFSVKDKSMSSLGKKILAFLKKPRLSAQEILQARQFIDSGRTNGSWHTESLKGFQDSLNDVAGDLRGVISKKYPALSGPLGEYHQASNALTGMAKYAARAGKRVLIDRLDAIGLGALAMFRPVEAGLMTVADVAIRAGRTPGPASLTAQGIRGLTGGIERVAASPVGQAVKNISRIGVRNLGRKLTE